MIGKRINKGGDGELTPAQEELLGHLSYDTDKDMITADSPISTTLNSFYLGEQHKMSSGAQNIFFTNLTSDIDFYPLWGGLKDQKDVANQDSTGLLQPSARVYGDNLLNEVTDPLDTSKIVDYRAVITVPENISIHGLTVNLQEPLIIGDTLCYAIKASSHTGNLVYHQDIVVDANYAVGDNFTFWYDHPAELLKGDINAINLSKNDHDLKVAGVTTSSEPWRTRHLRTFEDKSLIFPTENADKLLTNDIAANPGTAYIGKGYKDLQSYGEDATGTQFYGRGASSGQYYGRSATSGIEIGSTLGTDVTKKLISGTKSTTFAKIIDIANDGVIPTQNADKLIINDTSDSPGNAYIGKGYKDYQFYGYEATGSQTYGRSASGTQYYGMSATGEQYYGYGATATQYYGYGATGSQTYGMSASGTQYYGMSATGAQYYGFAASGAIEIGSALGTAITKKLVSGAGSATFAQIISAGTSSDKRLKDNIEPIESALAKVKTLTGCTFDMKLDDGTPERRTGLIAQDVQKVLPEAVMEDDSEDKYLSVIYGSIMGLAVEAIKELSGQVEELSSQVEELKLHNQEQSENINRLYTLIGEKPPTTKKWYQFWK